MTEPTEPTAAPVEVADPESYGVLADGPVRLLDAGEILARRRPMAIALVWLWELAGALLLATPVHAWAKNVFGAHPDGDAVVFRQGGHALLTWLGEGGPALSIVVRTLLVTLFALGLVGQIVTGALVASLATGIGPRGRRPPLAFALRAGLASFLPLLGIGVVALLAEGSVLAFGIGVSSSLSDALEPRVGDARAFVWSAALFVVLVVLALVLGVVCDLARVVVARGAAARLAQGGDAPAPAGLRQAAVLALRCARGHLPRAFAAWGWRAALAVALVWVGARAGDAVGGRGGAALWLLFAVHQALTFGRAALRASWLARALRLVAT